MVNLLLIKIHKKLNKKECSVSVVILRCESLKILKFRFKDAMILQIGWLNCQYGSFDSRQQGIFQISLQFYQGSK